jgi:hypothetical protein
MTTIPYKEGKGGRKWALTNRGSLETHNLCPEGACRRGDTKFREEDGSGIGRKGLEMKCNILINLAGATKEA